MSKMVGKLVKLLMEPREFFYDAQKEDWKPAFAFFSKVTAIISVITAVLNYLGMESTDVSSSYQAQIIAYRLVKGYLIDVCGSSAYLIEIAIIFSIASFMLVLLTLFIHMIYRLMGGRGSVLNAWKAACYGIGPCLVGGFLPYVALFAAFWSFSFQLYMGPMVLYKAKEGGAMFVFVCLIALTFIEMFITGTTVGF